MIIQQNGPEFRNEVYINGRSPVQGLINIKRVRVMPDSPWISLPSNPSWRDFKLVATDAMIQEVGFDRVRNTHWFIGNIDVRWHQMITKEQYDALDGIWRGAHAEVTEQDRYVRMDNKYNDGTMEQQYYLYVHEGGETMVGKVYTLARQLGIKLEVEIQE